MFKRNAPLGLLLLLCASAAALAQGLTIPAAPDGRPRQVDIHTLNGSIAVKTHAGGDIIVDGDGVKPPETAPGGMHRIDRPRGFRIEQDGNTVHIHSDPEGGNVVVTVPMDTSLTLKSLNGSIDVDGAHGEIDANTNNGHLRLTNVEGSVVAHSLNGGITVQLDRVSGSKPLFFSTLQGKIEVTLPADTKAQLKFDTLNGSVHSDFEVTLGGGKPIRADHARSIEGTINGGGIPITFYTLNGSVYLHKK